MSKRIVVTVVGLLVAVCAAWYFLSPGYAMSQLRDAAIAGDTTELEARVDFPAVREALKADMRTELADDLGDGGALLAGIADRLVDAVITPQTVAILVKQGKMTARDTAAGSREEIEWEVDRESFGRFRATPVTPDVKNAPSMIFEIDGLGWKLVEIDIPAGESAPL